MYVGHVAEASSPSWAALLGSPPAPVLLTQAPSWPLTAPALSALPSRWQAAVTRCPLCVLGGGGGSLQLLAAESQLPARLWGQRVTGDWPGGREPKTLEVTSGSLTLH